MTISQICICLAIAVYLIAMLGVGVWFSKRNNSVDDFYLGGRKLGPFVTAMSAEASDMSSWLLMGLPGVAYLSGLAEASWTAIGLAVGTYLNWLIVARRIRRYSHQIDAITVPQFFSKRWGDERNLLSAIAAVVIMIFFVPYLASGFSACGKLFASLFGINYVSAMLISAAVIVIYTVMGGFLAASFTDLVQSIIMTVALVVVLGFGVADNDRRKNQQTGEWEDYPNFIDCTMFGARAESLSRYLSKGTKVSIEGKLRWSQWEREGQKRSKIEVIVDELEFMSSRNSDSSSYGGGMGGGYSAPAAAPVVAAPVVDASSSVYDEDIPF